MKTFDYQVTNTLGIHARPAAMLHKHAFILKVRSYSNAMEKKLLEILFSRF